MKILNIIINFIRGLFNKKETDHEQIIKEYKKRIKEVDKELKNKYDNVDDAMKEWQDK